MKKWYRAFGDAVVTVSCAVQLDESVTAGMSEAQLREEVTKRAAAQFGGIHAYLGNGGDMKIIGVEKQHEIHFTRRNRGGRLQLPLGR